MATREQIARNTLPFPGIHEQGGTPVLNISREQIADKMWSESCQEILKEQEKLRPMFERHQKALEATAEFGRENKLKMNPLMQESWREFQVQKQVALERVKE